MAGSDEKLNEKYGDVDAMIGDATDEAPSEVPQRRRSRRSMPALSPFSGNKSGPTKMLDELKQKTADAEKELAEIKEKFAQEKEELLAKLEAANDGNGGSAPMTLTMPITKQQVEFELKYIDPSLIDVSPENERIQKFLDEISLQDILPSIRKNGQQKPGMLRPKKNGRFELIEGSRRLASVKVVGTEYLGLVGNVPDADIRDLSNIENKHKDVSAYEKAIAFKRLIEIGEYDSWTQIGAAKGISSSHINRYKSCAELDEIFVQILPSPSDMPLSYGETIAKLVKKGGELLKAKAQDLFEVRKRALKNHADSMDAEEIIKILKSAVRVKVDKPAQRRPVEYASKDGQIYIKHSVTNRGQTKLELAGVDDAKIEKILHFMTKTLKVQIKE